MRPNLFNALSESRSANGRAISNKSDFRMAFRCASKKWDLSFYDYFVTIYERPPYAEELERLQNLHKNDIASFIGDDILSLEFAVAFPQAVSRNTNAKVCRIIHPPKTAGTALFTKIEAHSSIPTWSYDSPGLPSENALKMPDFFDNAAKNGFIYARSHISLSDQNHLFRMTPGDSLVMLIRHPIDLLISQARHVARACYDYEFRMRDSSIAPVNNYYNENQASQIHDHLLSVERWLSYCEMRPEPTIAYIKALIFSDSFRADYVGSLQKYGGQVVLYADTPNFKFLLSSDVDHYLWYTHGISDSARINSASDWSLADDHISNIRAALKDSLSDDIDFFNGLISSAKLWRGD